MGINIYYRGSLSDPSELAEALGAIRAFCAKACWQCEDFSENYSGVALMTQDQAENPDKTSAPEEPWPDRPENDYGPRGRVSRLRPPPLLEETVTGVFVSPSASETLRFGFGNSGRLLNYVEFPAEFISNALPDTIHYIAFTHAVKVFDSPETHAAICLLLRMLKDRYMPNLEVTDATGFWETWDMKSLMGDHARMSALTGALRTSFGSGNLLKAVGVTIAGDGKIRLLDPVIKEAPPAKKNAPRVN
jgi:hypothetical protein